MKIQDSDIEFKEINDIQIPLSQRYNIKSNDDTPDKIMETVSSFWDYIVNSGAEVDKVLLPRIPERHRDQVTSKAGWLSEAFKYADDNLKLADDAIMQYTKEMDIPEQLITAPRSQYYEVARELRSKYGHGLRKAHNQTDELIKQHDAIQFDADKDLQQRIDKVHGHIRGLLNSWDEDAQKLIIQDLMRICYLELPGNVVGEAGYELSQANDGVLGIPSSPSGRSRGTWDIMIDFLVEQGFGKELTFENDVLCFHTYESPRDYATEGNIIRVIGGWKSVATALLEPKTHEDQLIARAYCKTKNATQVLIKNRNLIINGDEFGRIVSKAPIADGAYNIVNPGRPGKSQILHIAEC